MTEEQKEYNGIIAILVLAAIGIISVVGFFIYIVSWLVNNVTINI